MILKYHYALASILTAVFTFALSGFVFAKGKHIRVNKLYAFWAICVGLWSVFLVFNIYESNQTLALLWCRLLHVWAIILPAVYVHFVLEYIAGMENRKKIIGFLYGLSAIFVALDFSPWFLTATYRPQFDFFVTKPLLFYPAHVFIFVTSISYVYWELWQTFQRSRGIKRKQIQYFLLATIVGYSGGVTNYLINYDINIFPLYPFGNYTILGYVVIIGLSIVRYRFMDIEVIVKKTLVFAGLFAMVMAIVAAVATATQYFAARYFQVPLMLSTAVSVGIAILLYDPTRRLLIFATDRFLFQKKEDVQIILRKLSQEVVRIFDLEELGRTLLTTLQQTLRLESGGLLVTDARTKHYCVLNAFGCDSRKFQLGRDSLLIRFLAESRKILNFENPETRASFPLEIQQQLTPFKTVIVIPLFLQDDLTGLLLLGKKKSDEEFTREELEVFPTVANQVAIGLNFARKLADEKHLYAQMAQQAKMASIGTLSAGIGHEVGNVLNNIRGMVQTYQLWHKLGAWENFSLLEKEKAFHQIAGGVDANILRAQEIMNRLNALAKNPEELKPEPIDFNKSVETGVWFTQKDLEWAHIELEKQLAPDLPQALANAGVVEQTIMNLVGNAKDAIKMKGDPKEGKITVRTFPRDDKIVVQVGDNGIGIPQENLDKIFDPFFTTKDVTRNPDKNAVKGTGLGLFVVKMLVEHCGGMISVESSPGNGATFSIQFPIAKETTKS